MSGEVRVSEWVSALSVVRGFRGWLLAGLLLAGLAVLRASPLHAADTMRCGGRLVTVEDRAAELRSLCGTPDYRDVWTEQTLPQDLLGDTEEWYYNFGSNQLLRIVRIQNGRVVRIDTDGYGFPDAGASDARCDPGFIREGLNKYRLVRACGSPETRHVLQLLRPYSNDYDRYGRYRPQVVEPVFREEWVYNFGPRYLMRIVTLENGRVTDVENGERGYDPR